MSTRGKWKNLVEEALQSPYLIMLFGASVLLSIASFYTTFAGLTPFVDHWVFAFFITAAIQSLLFVVSWRIGFMYAGKEPVSPVDLGVFLVTFGLSVFFSFNSLYNVVFSEGQQLEMNLRAVQDGSIKAISEAEHRLTDKRTDLTNGLTGSDAYQQWRGFVDEIAAEAERSGDALRARLTRQREDKNAEYDRKAEAARSLAANKGTMGDEIRRLEADLEKAKASPVSIDVEGQRRQIEELNIAITTKEAEMREEEGGIGGTGQTGRGPAWEKLNKEKMLLESRRKTIADRIGIAQAQQDDYNRRVDELATKIREKKLLFENIDEEIAKRTAEARAAAEAAASFGSGDVGGTVQKLRERPKQFQQTMEVVHLEQAEGMCTELRDELLRLEPDRTLPSCDRTAIMPTVAKIDEINRALAALRTHCTGSEAPSPYEKGFDQALVMASDCLDLSKLPYRQIGDLYAVLDRLKRERGPNASPFTKTTNALLSFEKDGLLALILAISIDLLVLFTGLIGARSATAMITVVHLGESRRDSPIVASVKMLLRNLKQLNERIDGTLYESYIDLNEIDDEHARDQVRPLLTTNTKSGLIYAPLDQPGIFLLRHGAQSQFEDLLEKKMEEQGDYPQIGGAAPVRRSRSANPVPRQESRRGPIARDNRSTGVLELLLRRFQKRRDDHRSGPAIPGGYGPMGSQPGVQGASDRGMTGAPPFATHPGARPPASRIGPASLPPVELDEDDPFASFGLGLWSAEAGGSAGVDDGYGYVGEGRSTHGHASRDAGAYDAGRPPNPHAARYPDDDNPKSASPPESRLNLENGYDRDEDRTPRARRSVHSMGGDHDRDSEDLQGDAAWGAGSARHPKQAGDGLPAASDPWSSLERPATDRQGSPSDLQAMFKWMLDDKEGNPDR